MLSIESYERRLVTVVILRHKENYIKTISARCGFLLKTQSLVSEEQQYNMLFLNKSTKLGLGRSFETETNFA